MLQSLRYEAADKYSFELAYYAYAPVTLTVRPA